MIWYNTPSDHIQALRQVIPTHTFVYGPCKFRNSFLQSAFCRFTSCFGQAIRRGMEGGLVIVLSIAYNNATCIAINHRKLPLCT